MNNSKTSKYNNCEDTIAIIDPDQTAAANFKFDGMQASPAGSNAGDITSAFG